MSDDFESLSHEPEGDKKDRQISELQEALAQERDGRKSDRFVAILIAVILLDIHVFTGMPGWGGPIAILALEILLLLVLADKHDVSIVEQWLDKALNNVKGDA
ncbi:hypothetical protein PC39_01150 [Salinisphaera sp. PC39]|uniref:hypothetical protein n=1 Tax=Salinisphaera sp. PC39 TaxID=1304156 RepID=UPI0033415422